MMQYNLTKKQFNHLKGNFDLIPLIRAIKTDQDPIAIFEKISDKNSVLLHSPFIGKNSRYSIIATNPSSFFYLKNRVIRLNGEKIKGDPFIILQKLANGRKIKPANIPFNGGLIGFFSYDMSHYIEKFRKTAIDDLKLPDSCFGLYHNFIVHDNHKKTIKIVSVGDDYSNCINSINAMESRLNRKTKETNNKNRIKNKRIKISSNFTKDGYFKAIKKVKDYIFSGD